MKKVITISAFLVLTSISMAFAHGWWGSSEKMRGGHHDEGEGMGLYPIVSLSLKYKDKLGLNQKQVSSLEKIQSDFKKEAEANHEKLQLLRDEVKTALEQNNFAVVEEKIKEMSSLRTDLLVKRLKAFGEAKTNILTPEQYNKLAEKIKDKWC
jgi:Spy/CpxP family protein refolding chaperone